MAGFESFLADLVRNEAPASVGSAHASVSPFQSAPANAALSDTSHARNSPDSRSCRLVAQVLEEVVNASVLIAVVTGIANATEKGPAGFQRSGLALYAPKETVFFQTTAGALLAGDSDLEVCRALQGYCARLSFALRLIDAFADDNAQGSKVQPVDPEIVADACRRLCRAAIDCIVTLTGQLSGDAPCPVLPHPALLLRPSDAHPHPASMLRPSDAHPHPAVLDLLRQAAAGASPCLEPDGRVTIPGWAERRREQRRQMQRAATAQIGKRVMPVMIRDVSTSGLGLECTHAASTGERIVVRLPGDRPLAGVIAWAGDRRIGVRLDQRLGDGDPLLAD